MIFLVIFLFFSEKTSLMRGTERLNLEKPVQPNDLSRGPQQPFFNSEKKCPTQGSEQPFKCLEHKVTKTFAL